MWGLAAVAVALAGCQSSGGQTSVPNPTTWPQPLSTTTCAQWTDSMTEPQRFAVSKDIIRRLDAKDTSDSFAADFEKDVTTGCAAGVAGLNLSDVAAGIATLDTADFN